MRRIDPHPALLQRWGLNDDVAGLERFSLTVLEAVAPLAAAVKPQVALYERHGSAGIAVLERILAAAAEAAVLTIADAKRGDIGSTMAAYADAWLRDGSALAADSVTLSPYLGFESLRPALDLAAQTGRGVFVLALTSNPEGASVQHVGGADSVARPDRPGRRRRRTSGGYQAAGNWGPPGSSSARPSAPRSRTWTWTSQRCAARSWPRASARRAPRPRTCAAPSAAPTARSSGPPAGTFSAPARGSRT